MDLETRVRHWTALTVGRLRPSDAGQRRHTRILQGAATGLASKGVGTLVAIASVPLTLRYLGAERYGIWIAISTVLAWVQLADLGLGHGLTNAVAAALGEGDEERVRTDVATTFWFLVGIALALGLAYSVASPWIRWPTVFKVQSEDARREVGTAMGVAVALFLARFPLSVVERVYQAHQATSVSNLFQSAGSVTSLVAVFAVTRTQGGLVWLVVAFSGTQLVLGVASAAWLVGRERRYLLPSPRAFSWARGRSLVGMGWLFFLVQINSILIFQAGVLLIAHRLGAAEVTPYSVAWRLFSYGTLPATLIFPALWPAYVEALAVRDIAWIRRTLSVSLRTTLAMTLTGTILLVAFGRPLIRAWAGAAAVPPQALLFWMGLWTIGGTVGILFAALLNAAGRLVGQIGYGLVAAIANVGLALALVQPFGITGVIAALSISYLVFGLIPTIAETLWFVNRKLAPSSAPAEAASPATPPSLPTAQA